MTVSIIVVTRNALASLRRCLDSIRSGTRGLPCRVTIVDNASTDGTRQFLRSQPRRMAPLVLLNPRNLGKAAAINRAASQAPADWYAVLDDDAVVPRGWLSMLLAAAHRFAPAPSLVGCRSVYPDGRICCAEMMSWHESIGTMERDLGQRNYVRLCDSVSGICTLVEGRALRSLRFDESLFPFEDGDFCMRARSRGLSVLYYGPLAVKHEGLKRVAPGGPSPYRRLLAKWGYPEFVDSHPVDRAYARAMTAIRGQALGELLRACRLLRGRDPASWHAYWWAATALTRLGRPRAARLQLRRMARQPHLSPLVRARGELALELV